MPVNSTTPSRSRSGVSQDGTIGERDIVNPLETTPDTSGNDAWYYAKIAKYKDIDPEYYEYLLTNPYLIANSGQYVPYWTEKMIGTADTSATRYYNQLRSDANEWLARALSEHHVEDYTDPVAEVARRKAAGLNDDLSGGAQIGSGEPANPGKSDIDANLPRIGDPASPESIIGIATNIATTAIQIYQGVQGIRSASLSNDLKSLEYNTKLKETSWGIIKEGVSEYMSSNTAPSKEDLNDPNFVNLLPSSVATSFGNRVDRMPYSHKEKRKLKGIIDNLTFSFDSNGNKVATAEYQKLVNDQLAGLYDSRSGLVKSYGEIGADKDNVEAMKFLATEVYRPLNKLAIDLAKSNYTTQISTNNVQQLQNRFDVSYLNSALEQDVPGLKAGAEASEFMLRKSIKDVQEKVTKAFEDINNRLMSSDKLSQFWKFSLEAGLAAGESLLIKNLISH